MAASTAQACMSDFANALLNQNIDTALSLLADDALFFYSNGSVLTKAEFQRTMTAAWSVVENYSYSTSGIRWVIDSADAAVALYGFSWAGVARGQPVSGSGRATRVFVNGSAGWLLAHEHLSTGNAPA